MKQIKLLLLNKLINFSQHKQSKVIKVLCVAKATCTPLSPFSYQPPFSCSQPVSLASSSRSKPNVVSLLSPALFLWSHKMPFPYQTSLSRACRCMIGRPLPLFTRSVLTRRRHRFDEFSESLQDFWWLSTAWWPYFSRFGRFSNQACPNSESLQRPCPIVTLLGKSSP